jgi:outer membrane protein assembly factor BamB
VLANFDGQMQVIINGNPDVSAYDPENGKLLWSAPGLSGDVAPSVAVNSKLVYAVTDYAALIAIKPENGSQPVWQDNSYTPDVSSPVANDDILVLTTSAGDVACYDAMKGDTLWTRYLVNTFYASPIICDGKLWMLDRTGKMHIAEAAEKFKMIGSPDLGESSDCTPAFSEGMIIVRGRKHVYCISAK